MNTKKLEDYVKAYQAFINGTASEIERFNTWALASLKATASICRFSTWTLTASGAAIVLILGNIDSTNKLLLSHNFSKTIVLLLLLSLLISSCIGIVIRILSISTYACIEVFEHVGAMNNPLFKAGSVNLNDATETLRELNKDAELRAALDKLLEKSPEEMKKTLATKFGEVTEAIPNLQDTIKAIDNNLYRLFRVSRKLIKPIIVLVILQFLVFSIFLVTASYVVVAIE